MKGNTTWITNVEDKRYQNVDVSKTNKEENQQSLRNIATRINNVEDEDYQKLDPPKINTEDNDDDDSFCTQLNQFLGDENKYQSLTSLKQQFYY